MENTYSVAEYYYKLSKDGKTLDAEKFNCATSMQAGDDGKAENTDGKKNLFQAFVEVCKAKGSCLLCLSK